jgi:hypothetical protein
MQKHRVRVSETADALLGDDPQRTVTRLAAAHKVALGERNPEDTCCMVSLKGNDHTFITYEHRGALYVVTVTEAVNGGLIDDPFEGDEYVQ